MKRIELIIISAIVTGFLLFGYHTLINMSKYEWKEQIFECEEGNLLTLNNNCSCVKYGQIMDILKKVTCFEEDDCYLFIGENSCYYKEKVEI